MEEEDRRQVYMGYRSEEEEEEEEEEDKIWQFFHFTDSIYTTKKCLLLLCNLSFMCADYMVFGIQRDKDHIISTHERQVAQEQ